MPTDHLYKRGEIYHCWWYDARGKLQRRSTGCRDRRAATAVLAKLERRAQGAADVSRDVEAHAVDDALAAFLDHGCIDLAPETVRMYEEKAGHVARLLGQLDVHQLTQDILQQYIKTRLAEPMRKRTAARSTIAKELTTLRQALKMAHERGAFVGDPKSVFPRFRVKYEPRTRFLTQDEFRALLAELSPHRQLWLLVAVYTGGRDSEIDALCWEHIDWALRTVLLPGTKTKRSRRLVPLHPLLSQVLTRGRVARGHIVGEWMNVRRDLAAACVRARIAKVSPNDLRRTFASWLKQDGVDSAIVARLLGHSSTRMVDLVYGQLDAATLARALDRLPGGGCERGVKDVSGGAGQNGHRGLLQLPENSVSSVLGPGIEPGTRGFSIRASSAPDARITKRYANRVAECETGVKALRIVKGGKK